MRDIEIVLFATLGYLLERNGVVQVNRGPLTYKVTKIFGWFPIAIDTCIWYSTPDTFLTWPFISYLAS
jgi:hypothetical protein